MMSTDEKTALTLIARDTRAILKGYLGDIRAAIRGGGARQLRLRTGRIGYAAVAFLDKRDGQDWQCIVHRSLDVRGLRELQMFVAGWVDGIAHVKERE